MKTIYFLSFLLFICSTLLSQNFPKYDDVFRLRQLTPPVGKVSMVLDTDTYNEVDDQFALAYAYLSKEKIDLMAVYAAPFHNRYSNSPKDGMEKSYMEIIKLLKFMGKSSDNFAFHGSDTYLSDVSQPIRSDAALDLVKKAMLHNPDNPLYVLAVGCLTNVASAVLIEPNIIKNIVIVWLGGHGLDWPHQKEFNLRQDILATQVVLDSGVPLVVVPCRPVASHFNTTIPELKYYLEDKNKLSNYLYDIVVSYSAGKDVWSKVIWDVVAVAWVVNSAWVPSDLVHSPILTDQVTYSVDNSRHFIRVANTINRDAILKDLFEKLSKKSD